MSDPNKIKPTGFRITEETAEKFRELTKDLGGSQQQALAELIEVYEMAKGREAMPEMQGNIDTFEGYIRAAASMYMQSLENNQNMRALVRTEYEGQLRSKDRTIAELQMRTDIAETTAASISSREQDYKDRIHALEKAEKELNKTIEDNRDSFQKKLEESQNTYEELKASYQKLQASEEEIRSLVSSAMKEAEEKKEENNALHAEQRVLEGNIADLTRSNASLSEEIERLKARTEEDIKRLKEKAEEELSRHRSEVEQVKANCETEKRLAVQEMKNALQEKHIAELEAVRRELDKYKELYYQKQNGIE